MKDKNVYRANISWKPLFLGLLFFEIFEYFPAKNEFFDFFRKKTPSFDVAGNFKREFKSFPCDLYSAEFAFYSARNPRSLSDFVLTQHVQGCARKGIFQKKHQNFCFEDSFYDVLGCIYRENIQKR